ncbi:hypothetical protein KDK88_00380, partial [bacterium]|nr:hypothetical protein [bacterium]
MPSPASEPSRARRYADLCMAAALNLPLIAAALLLAVAGAHPTLLGKAYGAGVIVGYYGLPLLLAVSVLFLILWPWRRAATAAAAVASTLYLAYLAADAA